MTTTTTPRPARNGVDTPTLFATLDAVKEAPAAAQFQFRARNRWVNGTHSSSTIDGYFGVGEERAHARTFTFDADHPAVLVGRDNGPTPVEFLLHALASCVTAGVANIATARGVTLTEVTSTVEGDIDLNGLLGLDSEVRNGYQRITVRFTIKGDSAAEKLAAIVEQSRARSAVYDVITNGVPVDIQVDAAYRPMSELATAARITEVVPGPPLPDPSGVVGRGPRAHAALARGRDPLRPRHRGTISKSSVSPLAGWATGATIYGGSAQLATVELLDRGAAPVTIILTALIINARLIAYSGSIAVYWRGDQPSFPHAGRLPPRRSIVRGGHGSLRRPGRRTARPPALPGGAVAPVRRLAGGDRRRSERGSGPPPWLHLEFVVPLYLVAQVVRHGNRSREARAAAVVGGAVAIAGMDLPISSGLIVAIVAGIAAAVATDRLARAQGTKR